jgi:aryl-alcohol dehydrogenase-like predicted oxidoreductase
MEYINLGKSGLKVSRLCLGTMNMGSPSWKPWIFNAEQSVPIIKYALDTGVNFIDLADFYSAGKGEEVVGGIINKLVNRDEIVITTKVGYGTGGGINQTGHSRKNILTSINHSLKRIGTDYIDIYMLHFFDTSSPIDETLSAMNEIIRSGKARYFGVSTMTVGQLATILISCERNGFVKPINMQLQLNCAYREEEREMIPFCIDQGIGISVFSPLARGILSGELSSTRNTTDFFTQQMYGDKASFEIMKSVGRVAKTKNLTMAQVAQAWVLQRPGIQSMLVGADTVDQFKTATQALNTQFTQEDLYEIDRNYTPCDLINDYTNEKRIPRVAREAKGIFIDVEV